MTTTLACEQIGCMAQALRSTQSFRHTGKSVLLWESHLQSAGWLHAKSMLYEMVIAVRWRVKVHECQGVSVLRAVYAQKQSSVIAISLEEEKLSPRKYRKKCKCSSCSYRHRYFISSVILELLRIATGKALQYRNDSKELLQWSLTHADALELKMQG